MLNRKYILIAAVFVIFLSFNVLFSQNRIGYDTGRNEKIATEFAYYGTFTYFDVPFIVSPPLYFIIHSYPVAVLGSSQWVFRLTEAVLYFVGALLVFFIVNEIGLPKNTARNVGLFVFAMLLVDRMMFVNIHTIDFWGAILLVSSLTLLLYMRLYRRPGLVSAAMFGIAAGVGMLTKSSFLFLLIPLILHYIVFAIARKDVPRAALILVSLVVGGALYAPWAYYLTSNGFPLITNPEARGEVPWDPHFTGYSFQDVYAVAFNYWPLLYPFSLLISVYFFYEHYRSIRFEASIELKKRLMYIWYKYSGGLGGVLIMLLLTAGLLPFFNRLIVAIPVGEQFLSIALASYLMLGIVFFKTERRKVKILIAGVLAANIAWGAVSVTPVAAWQEYQETCGLYTDFFSSLNASASVLIDEKLSSIAYPAHNALYPAFFEWFSYQDQYDVSRIVSLNVNYVVLTDRRQTPDYMNSPAFAYAGSYLCEGGGNTYNATVFTVDGKYFAHSAGLNEQALFTVHGGGKPVQALADVSKDGFSFHYKSKRDGSLAVSVPEAGTYTIHVIRPGFLPKTLKATFPGTGNILINLEADSPFRTHTTANRY